jgi:PAS domain S-box-containing protein
LGRGLAATCADDATPYIRAVTVPLDVVLASNVGEIVRRWAERARRLPSAAALSESALVDNFPPFLHELARWLSGQAPAAELVNALADKHAEQRFASGVGLPHMIEEYRLLRRTLLEVVLDRWAEQVSGDHRKSVVALRRLDEGLDHAISEAVTRFVAEQNRERLLVEERLRLALASAALGTWDYDPHAMTLDWDERSREIFGVASDSSSTTLSRFLEAVHPRDRARVQNAVGRALAGEEGGTYRVQFRVAKEESAPRTWVDARGKVLFDGEGRAVRFVGTMLDVTDVKAADELRDRFMGVLGHDLRAPLNAITTGIGHLMKSGQLPAGTERAAGRIAHAADRMSRIIRDVLDFTRVRVGSGIPITPTLVNLSEVCRRVVEEARRAHPSRHISLELQGDLAGHWDGDRLVQLVTSLVANAILHGRDPVTVRAGATEGGAVVEVTNRGAPATEEELAKMFEPFRRSRQEGDGLGLGLYLVAEIVRAHRGRIAARSSGDVVAFEVRLPWTPAGSLP